MTTPALVRPIDNIDDPEEALVLGVVAHLVPTLTAWRQGKDLRAQLEAAQKATPGLQQALDAARAAQAQASQAEAGAKGWDFDERVWGVLGAAVALGFLVSLASDMLGLATFVGLSAWAGKMARDKAGATRQQLSQARGAADADLARHDAILKGNLARIESVRKEQASRAMTFPRIEVTPLEFKLKPEQVAGHTVLLDLSESHPAVKLKAVDVSGMEAGLSGISEKVAALLNVPPLLTPDDTVPGGDPVHELFGEESDLQQMVSQFTLGLGRLRDIELNLPLVPRNSALHARLESGRLLPAMQGPALQIASALPPGAIGEFVAQVNSNRERGLAVFAELDRVFHDLDRACALYARARVQSVNTLHHNLLGVLSSASWCSRRFYCPRTIQSPQYVEDLLGIHASRAYLLSFDDLLARLRGDAEIARRLDSHPELETTLAESYDATQEFMEGAHFDAEGGRLEGEQRARHIEAQFEEAANYFIRSLHRVMTGSAYPVLNFSAEARLYYDPEGEEWSSNISPYVYTSADTMKYGSVVKAYSDLMIPLWEHLWTEKADFRKSELFRTNEEMRRMTEKESEKLIDIANQFRADMRAVRENVYLLESELSAKHSEILSFRNSMTALGLMSESAARAVSDEKLQTLVAGDSTLAVAERYEVILAAMPQAQAENRGAVHDPIDMVREPSALLTHRAAPQARLLAN